LGKMVVSINKQAVDSTKMMMYRGFMPQGVPNFFVGFGYTNASWTLKVELSCDLMCRVMQYMENKGLGYCTPTVVDPEVEPEEFNELSSSYIVRNKDLFPKMGTKAPWKLYQNYFLDYASFNWNGPTDPSLIYSTARNDPEADLLETHVGEVLPASAISVAKF
jgi:monooxygenase